MTFFKKEKQSGVLIHIITCVYDHGAYVTRYTPIYTVALLRQNKIGFDVICTVQVSLGFAHAYVVTR